MIDITAARPLDEPSRRLLEAYASAADVLQATDPEHDGHVDRLREIDGIDDADLPMLHGRLLAAGLIDFDLNDRDGGVYSVTSEGRKALSTDAASESDAA